MRSSTNIKIDAVITWAYGDDLGQKNGQRLCLVGHGHPRQPSRRRKLEKRQGLQVGSPDEIAFEQGWIDSDHVRKRVEVFKKNDYGRNLDRLLKN